MGKHLRAFLDDWGVLVVIVGIALVVGMGVFYFVDDAQKQRRAKAAAAEISPPAALPADICMLDDGRPAYLEVDPTEDYITVAYLDTKGNMVIRIYWRAYLTQNDNRAGGSMTIPGARCASARQ